MKARLWVCLLIGLLILSVLPAAAQDDHKEELAALNCLGLSEADCAIVEGSMQHDITSFGIDFSFTTSSANTEDIAIPGLGGAVDVQGSGTVNVDKSAMTEENPLAGIAVAFDITANMTDEEGPTTHDVNFVLADGNIYIHNAAGEWVGTSVADIMEHPEALQGMMGNMSFMGMPMPMGQMMQMGPGAMSGDLEDMGEMMGDFDLERILSLPGFLNQSRLDDETVDGQTMSVFAFTADLGVLLQDEDVQTALSGMMSQGMSGAGGNNPMAGQMAAMMPVVLQNTTGTVTLTRWIGADDGLPHRVMVDVQAAIDLFGEASGNNTPIPPITFSVTLDVKLSGLNDTPAPSAPEGATVVPVEEFFGTTPEATP
jgi:hypothetical protein